MSGEPLDLESIKARLAAAIPGPWESGRSVEGLLGIYCLSAAFRLAWLDGSRETDADLIANAPADIAALIAEVERLRDGLRAVLDCGDDGPMFRAALACLRPRADSYSSTHSSG